MTRVLAALLGIQSPHFLLGLQELEQRTGRKNTDIRLSAEVLQAARQKLLLLGLDPDDTTGHELYAVLGQRLQADEQRLISRLTETGIAEPLTQLSRLLNTYLQPIRCYALKPSAARKLLKANAPKRTMKLLGYRSVDSLLKHESAAALCAVAWQVESSAWAKKQLNSYAKLQATDFEMRQLSIETITSKRWSAVTEALPAGRGVLCVKEQGAVVVLPQEPARYSVIAAVVLSLHAANDIRATSTYLKLHQMQPNFGAAVQRGVTGHTVVGTQLLGRPLAWQTVQQYFARLGQGVSRDVFEPFISAEEFVWHGVERILADLEPGFMFWSGSSYVAHQDQQGHVVSLNIVDTVLSHANGLPYAAHCIEQFRHELTTELSVRYMLDERMRESVIGQLQRQFATEPALA